MKEDDEDTYTTSKQIVLKPGKVHEISLIFTSKVVLTSTNFYGDLYIS